MQSKIFPWLCNLRALSGGGTISELPEASQENNGHVYKVITEGTYQGTHAKVGDTFISNGSSWVLIPSGDEPGGTVTSVGLETIDDNIINLEVTDGSPVTTSGTIKIKGTHANSGVTANTYTKVTVDSKGHVTDGENLAKEDVTTALGFTPENSSNKVTEIDSTSNDNQYPSAKAVYDHVAANKTPLMESVTYSQLKSKRDNGQLVSGQEYRITDYQCTTTQAETQSANHQFDIIVTADSSTILNENARAIKHDGDTYFNACNLNAWELKYCIDNDTDRFLWADTSTGKGVIYYMKDEWNNECPYDFKNIMFYRTLDSNGNYVAEGGTNTAVYTFDKNVDGIHSDISLIGGCKNNIIKEYIQNSKYSLSDNVFLDTNTTASYNNMLGVNSIHNTFGNNCYYNKIGSNSFSNVFGNGCSYNTITNNAYRNVFGNSCSFNTINDNVYNCKFGIECYRNSIGCTCSFNTFGNYFQSNTLGCCCNNNTFGDGCKDNIFGGTNINNTFGQNFQKNTVENYCQSNVFGNSVQQNHFGIGFSNSSIGASSYFNSFGNNCTYIKTNNSFYNNKLGDGCKYLNFNYDNTRNAFVFNGTGQKFTSYQSVRCVCDDCIFVGVKSDGTLRAWSPANT